MPRFNRISESGMDIIKLIEDQGNTVPDPVKDAVKSGKAKATRATVEIKIDGRVVPELSREAFVVMFDEDQMILVPSVMRFIKKVGEDLDENRTANMYEVEFTSGAPGPGDGRVLVCRDTKLGYAFVVPCDEDGKYVSERPALFRNGLFETDTDFILDYSKSNELKTKITIIGDPGNG